MSPIDQLLAMLDAAKTWPLPQEAEIRKTVAKWRAFWTGDREALREVAGWENKERRYHVDNLGGRIAEAFANLLYDQPPAITAAQEGDQGFVDAIVEENDLPTELHTAAEQSVAEGEVWARVFTDPELADTPLISWHSRLEVVPLWIGPKLIGVAFVTELRKQDRQGKTKKTVWRHFELHEAGAVVNALYRGTEQKIGIRVDLSDHPETAELEEEWRHGFDFMLAWRIPNKAPKWTRLRERRVGVSQLAGIEDELLTLNEAAAIGAENMRLTAKKRVIVPEGTVEAAPPNALELEDQGDGSFLPAAPTAKFDASEDVLVASPLDEELGKGNEVFKVLEYSFDADALIAYRRDVEHQAITRASLTSVYIGTDEATGAAPTGIALRTKLIPTKSAGDGKGRRFDAVVPKILLACQMVDQLPVEQGGFGRGYAGATEPPAVERADTLPRDEVEEITSHGAAVTARIESTRTAIESLHPDWSEEQIQEELKAIRDDVQTSTPAFGALA